MENKEDINLKEGIQKSKRIGTLTFGIMLILFGIVMILQIFIKTDIFRYVLTLWPLIFISLGIEAIYYACKIDIKIKYDVWAVILTFMVLGFGLLFGIANYGLNQFLYNDEIRGIFIDSIQDANYSYSFDNKATIRNLSGKDIEYSTVIDDMFDDVKVEIKAQYEYSDSWKLSLLIHNNNWLYDNVEVGDNKIIIKELPDFVKNVKVTVYANDASKIEYIK